MYFPFMALPDSISGLFTTRAEFFSKLSSSFLNITTVVIWTGRTVFPGCKPGSCRDVGWEQQTEAPVVKPTAFRDLLRHQINKVVHRPDSDSGSKSAADNNVILK